MEAVRWLNAGGKDVDAFLARLDRQWTPKLIIPVRLYDFRNCAVLPANLSAAMNVVTSTVVATVFCDDLRSHRLNLDVWLKVITPANQHVLCFFFLRLGLLLFLFSGFLFLLGGPTQDAS